MNHSAQHAGAELLAIPVAMIVPSPDNPRKAFPEHELQELGDSMVAIGQMTPALVRPHPKQQGKYELAAGESRWRAAKLRHLATLECHVREMTDPQFYTVLAWENLKRRNLKPLDEARAYELLLKKSEGWAGDRWTVERIAKDGGVSVDYVRDRLRLFKLAPAAVTLLEADRIPLSHALELAKLTQDQQTTLVTDTDCWDAGLWRQDDGASHQTTAERKKDPYAGLALGSLRELRARIEDTFPVDPAAESTPELFPELAEAMRAAQEKAVPVVQITDAYQAPEVDAGAPAILSRREWRRADGSKGAPTCKYATQLGVGVLGGVRSQSFMVCIAATECRKHFGDEIRYAEIEKARKTSTGSPSKAKESAWERRARLDREAKARFKPAIPAIRAALAKAIAAASTKVDGPLDQLVARGRKWPKEKDGVGRGTTPEDLMRYLAWREIGANEWNAHEELPRVGKQLGVNVAAIVKAHAKPVKKAAQKAAKKRARA